LNSFKISPSFERQGFLEQYWQKKPVLLQGLIPDFLDPISPEELAGLACEAEIESRIVRASQPDVWELTEGPFPEFTFQELPDSNWTVLVQAVDQWLESVAQLKHGFNFVPSWRIDDVMVSFATPGGGVGPHYDNYDVFIIQGLGSRRWRIGAKCGDTTPLTDNSELRIIAEFNQHEEYFLQPGDALYIPPGYSHWGVAQTDSLCYSLGFRAPSFGEMLEGLSDRIIDNLPATRRFVDYKPSIPKRVGEIDIQAIGETFQELKELITSKTEFERWFGCHVTRSKYPDQIPPPLKSIHPNDLRTLLQSAQLCRHPASRYAFQEHTEGSKLILFVDGEEFLLGIDLINLVSLLCSSNALSNDNFSILLESNAAQDLVASLLNQGSLTFQS
jgi:50S ribosomal protein L16 3-hydroxylase